MLAAIALSLSLSLGLLSSIRLLTLAGRAASPATRIDHA